MRLPAESVDRRELAALREQHRVVPGEDADVEPAAALRKEVEEVAQHPRHAGEAVMQLCAAVKVHTHDDERSRGTQRRVYERLEVVLAVDNEGHAVGVPHAITIATGREQAGPTGGRRGIPLRERASRGETADCLQRLLPWGGALTRRDGARSAAPLRGDRARAWGSHRGALG